MQIPGSGLILIDKPAGMSSHDVVDRVRRVAGTRAVGHAGTLDPFATGLLILGVNKGTKLLTGLVGLPKAYEATARLGATTNTFDLEGEIHVMNSAKEPTPEQIESVLTRFRGGYDQLAPLFSAKKIKGKKLYELARSGEATEALRPMKRVEIPELRVLDYRWPELRFFVRCSSGTYIRSLADDIGSALGVGAYLTSLRRTEIGSYSVDRAIPLADLTSERLQTSIFWLDLDK